MIVWMPVSNAHLDRALRLQRWACVFYGVALLSLLQQLARWFALRVLEPWIVLVAALALYLFFRGLSSAATRRWHEAQAKKFMHDVFADGGHGK